MRTDYKTLTQRNNMITIQLDKGKAIVDEKCVNSKYKARFLSSDEEDYCQCSFGECKVKVSIAYNGHEPYDYTLTENEIHNLSVIPASQDKE